MPSKPNNLNHVTRDTGYRFTERDPVMVEVCDIITKSGHSLKYIENRCGVCVSTMNNWVKGRTRRPQNITMDFVLKVLGYERRLVKVRAN